MTAPTDDPFSGCARAFGLGGTLGIETIAPRRNLVREGRACEQLVVVHAGWLMAFRQLPDGSRQIFNFWLPGDLAGIELLAFPVAPYSVATLTECRISRLNRNHADRAANSLPGDVSVLTMLACRTGLILRERIVSLGRRSAFCRVAHLLLELSLRAGTGEQVGPLPLTQLEIADSTGLTAPYVNRIFRSMRERGFLESSKEGCELRDTEKLMKLVEFRPQYLQTVADALRPRREMLAVQ